MRKTTFKIKQMDCLAEEQLIRMKLAEIAEIKSLEFDLPNRILKVYHENLEEKIFEELNKLQLDTSVMATQSIEDFKKNDYQKERKLLWRVLNINFSFFILEVIAGFVAHSMGLLADGLDMFADSIVYGLALFAVGGVPARKKRIAGLMGIFQLFLTITGFAEVIRRFIGSETIPSFSLMIIISLIAMGGNILTLYLLQKNKSQEVHLKASTICTSNDVIVNFGVILAGILVLITRSKYPDLIVGLIVFILVGSGALKILKLSR